MTVPVLRADMSFDEAARVVLLHLREHLPMGFWSVTRVENGRQSYLYLDENDFGLTQGSSHPWQDSFCVHMAAGRGPSIAPDAQAVPVYAAAAVNAAGPIGAYAGTVINEPDGSLFGAICGLDKQSRTGDASFAEAGPLLSLLGQLLSMVLAAERMRDALAEQVLRHTIEAETDVLTGLYNRRAWERVLAEEEVRFSRVGDPTIVALTDLDFLKSINDADGHAAGDAYIRRAGQTLLGAVRSDDVVARLGGDEFAVLLRNCDQAGAQARVAGIYAAMDRAGVATSLGWAPITILHGFPAAIAEADEAMYAAKRERRRLRTLTG